MSQHFLQPLLSLRWRVIGLLAITLVVLHLLFDGRRLGDGLHLSVPLDALKGHLAGAAAGSTKAETETEEEVIRKAYPQLPPPDEEEYVAICMAVKDQHLDLPEFLVHHYHHMGIRRFYIMDDGSTPSLSTVEDYGIPRDTITFEYFNETQRQMPMQHWIYNRCQEVYGHKHTWIAYLDADEFLEMRHPNDTLIEFLHDFDNDPKVGAVAVNWRMHTSSSHLTRQKSVRKSYTTCIYDDPEHNGAASDNRHVKSIVKTAFYAGAINPHVFSTGSEAKTVGEDGKLYAENPSPWRNPITRRRVSLHHYAVKSKKEYEQKMLRSNGMGDPKTWEFWNHVESLPHVPCTEMETYYP